jgi:hypothetical protein
MRRDRAREGDALCDAEVALRPHMDRLRRDTEKVRATGGRLRNWIVVPLGFPARCDSMLLWGLPVARGHVLEPELG